jgi:hypothetical protein
MKRLLPFFLLLSLCFSQACEGPEGPAGPPGPAGTAGAPGPAGPAGPAGTSVTGTVFEFEADFAAPDYAVGGAYPTGVTVGEADIVLVYLLYTVTQDNTPYWAPLPQTFMVNAKPITYNAAFSTKGLLVFVEAEADVLTAAGDPYLKQQAFRAVVIPGKRLRTDGRGAKFNPKDYPVDFNNYQEVIRYFNLSDQNVRRVTLR